MSATPGQSLATTIAEWFAALAPAGYVANWLFTKGRDGSQLTITGQAALLKTLQENVDNLTERLEKLASQLDERDRDARSMSDRIHRLEMQIVQLGATPVA